MTSLYHTERSFLHAIGILMPLFSGRSIGLISLWFGLAALVIGGIAVWFGFVASPSSTPNEFCFQRASVPVSCFSTRADCAEAEAKDLGPITTHCRRREEMPSTSLR